LRVEVDGEFDDKLIEDPELNKEIAKRLPELEKARQPFYKKFVQTINALL